MNRGMSGPTVAALGAAVLLASLSLVAWRQGAAREVLGELDGIRREAALARAERADLLHRTRYLESRGRVIPEAMERLEMHVPNADEIVILPAETP